MLDIFVLSLALLAGEPAHAPAPVQQQLSDDQIESIRKACAVSESAKFIDARDMASADELSTYLEAFDHPDSIVHGAEFPGEDVEVLLGKLGGGGSCIHDSDLSNTRAPGAEFRNSTIIRSSIEGAYWAGSDLEGTRFIGVNAKRAKLAGAMMRGGSWSGGYWNSNLEKTDFTGALMIGFRFECGITLDESCGANEGANFTSVDFSAADLSEFPSWGFDTFDKAFFEGARIHPRGVTGLKNIALGANIYLASSVNRSGFEDVSARLSEAEFIQLRNSAISQGGDAPSFDCAKAGIFVEKEICGKYNSQLRQLDREMAQLYSAARIAGKASKTSQRKWLSERDECYFSECIEQSYEERIGVLFAALAKPLVLAPDASLSFYQDVLPVSDAMRSSELYRRAVPVLKSASMQQVLLTGLENGNIRIEGDAVGANAHTCGWNAEVRFNSKTGWYEAQGEAGKPVRMFRIWRGRLIPAYSGNLGNTPEEAIDFISCGARAGFDEMRQLDGSI